MSQTIGLALSGGGSRAVAFHLGCLRALHKRNLLCKVSVLSAVSGGAVIAAMYAYSNDSFEEFDQRVLDFLSKGIQNDIAIRFFFSERILQATFTLLTAGLFAFVTKTIKSILSFLYSINPYKKTAITPKWINQIQSPFPRWVSRTNAFEDVLRDKLFGRKKITDSTRDNLSIILNATELRTGTAFRYGNQNSSCWRYGKIKNNNVEVAEAVAASAAYPLLLPSIHKTYNFIDRNDNEIIEDVIITDGGVFDNSGVTCLEPNRNPNFTQHVYSCDHIISCNAGHGQFLGEEIPYFLTDRLAKSFSTSARKLQDSITQRLFLYREQNLLKSLILPYLGQQDKDLFRNCGEDNIPQNFVKKSEVEGYPTDFAAMPKDDIKKITLRGEQLTNILIDAYWSDKSESA